jgi:nitroimidazol reductase NimA-like FMN-containing flavoprotein (pyridoxamine 5'-phosphate oxidase superfamily)
VGRDDDGVQQDAGDLETLSVDECFDLLRRCTVGRVAVNAEHMGPLVVPVNFVLDGDAVVFRTDDGTKVRLLGDGYVSFEVDSIDHAHHTGWSVLVRGIAYEAQPWEVRDLDLVTWTSGSKDHWIRIVPGRVTGRRIVLTSLPVDDRGYR